MIIDFIRSPRYFVHKSGILFKATFVRNLPYYIRFYDDMTWECVYSDGYVQSMQNMEKYPENLWLEITKSSLRSLLEPCERATCSSCGRVDYRCLSRGCCVLKPY